MTSPPPTQPNQSRRSSWGGDKSVGALRNEGGSQGKRRAEKHYREGLGDGPLPTPFPAVLPTSFSAQRPHLTKAFLVPMAQGCHFHPLAQSQTLRPLMSPCPLSFQHLPPGSPGGYLFFPCTPPPDIRLLEAGTPSVYCCTSTLVRAGTQ